ncbi:hypothetical protein [Serratia marcescens]|uniref:hypothetical protein n=1 Tax=Serratia marcescens TaxID=615 RepID=UPI0029CDF44B|nr:hypothetical protein [Serratia marcescens]HEJ0019593.1 hypothetical protein [Serratia marcescens]
MITLYTVDRLGFYQSNKYISLIKRSVNRPELDDYLDKLFPNGLSHHGMTYFWSGHSKPVDIASALELHIEMHRRALHADKPSRFTSIFCCQSIDEAIQFRDRNGPACFPIYEVQCDEKTIHIADMNIINPAATTLVFSQHMDMYWSGQSVKEFLPDHPEFKEVIVPLPATIGARVV